jgi:ketosteroid isomerase-like protein
MFLCGQRWIERSAMLDRAWAERFAADWIAAWNAHDLDAILSHYADDVVFHSPRIALVMGEAVDLVAGKPALARYWKKALAQSQDLHFTAERLYIGSDSLTIAYRSHRNQSVTETFVFDSGGLVKESVAAYQRTP